MVGYSGSSDPSANPNPTYKNAKDYAESIRVTFDDTTTKVTSYADVVDMFFAFHTAENPEWCGSQYRSAIFVRTAEQRTAAEEAVKRWGAFGRFVSVEEASDFYKAEEYHQKYMEKFMG